MGSFREIFVYKIFCASTVAIAFLSPALAKETRYKDYPFEVRETDRIVIQNLRGSVRLTAGTGRNAILKARKQIPDRSSSEDMARFDALSFAVKREGSALIVEGKGPDGKAAWAQWLKPNGPELHIELEAPSVPVEISLREGQVNSLGWKQSIAVVMMNGGIRSSGGEGLLRLQLQRGEVKVESHRGKVEVDSYGAKIAINALEGDLQLSNFGGESNLSALKGNLEVASHSGAIIVSKSTGSADFTTGRGTVNFSEFEGPLKGQADQGSVVVGVEGEAEVSIDSLQAPVTVKLPQNSGASLRLKSDEGVLNIPESLRGAGSVGKVYNGRLRGDGSKGNVVVKSKSGNVRVRY